MHYKQDPKKLSDFLTVY